MTVAEEDNERYNPEYCYCYKRGIEIKNDKQYHLFDPGELNLFVEMNKLDKGK
ncbi:11699_t:CDS:1, partial [Dentiscutata erythropus]